MTKLPSPAAVAVTILASLIGVGNFTTSSLEPENVNGFALAAAAADEALAAAAELAATAEFSASTDARAADSDASAAACCEARSSVVDAGVGEGEECAALAFSPPLTAAPIPPINAKTTS